VRYAHLSKQEDVVIIAQMDAHKRHNQSVVVRMDLYVQPIHPLQKVIQHFLVYVPPMTQLIQQKLGLQIIQIVRDVSSTEDAATWR